MNLNQIVQTIAFSLDVVEWIGVVTKSALVIANHCFYRSIVLIRILSDRLYPSSLVNV